MINVGPAKPKHKLPESERKALLSESQEGEIANQSVGYDEIANQSVEHDETPQIEPYLETSFNTTEPLNAVSEPGDVTTSVVESPGNEKKCLITCSSWRTLENSITIFFGHLFLLYLQQHSVIFTIRFYIFLGVNLPRK